MKILKTISGGLLATTMLLCFAPGSEAARGCDEQDEERWEQMKAELPTADGMKVRAIIYDLTKLKDKCDPKTRFSASVVRTLIAANFRQAELDEAQGRSRRYIDFRRMQR